MWIVDAMHAKSEAAGPGTTDSRIHTWKMEDMSLGQSIWIGFCQIFSAVFPGTSRSMSTIAGGQIAGMSRASALEFSFFVSIPTMAAATLYTLLKSLRGKGRKSDRRLADRCARVDRARHRLCRLVHRRLCFGGLVHGLRAQTRIRAVRGLPDHRGSARAGVSQREWQDDSARAA